MYIVFVLIKISCRFRFFFLRDGIFCLIHSIHFVVLSKCVVLFSHDGSRSVSGELFHKLFLSSEIMIQIL